MFVGLDVEVADRVVDELDEGLVGRIGYDSAWVTYSARILVEQHGGRVYSECRLVVDRQFTKSGGEGDGGMGVF